ncbi:AraC family transcriptional regulator [Neolewinella lacunae]|uniref:Helix-turn-helix transcriptional regulator n=1 Tax=Neolewinella lacunae TaxID=1517758 RepID=A0A923PGL0_9BACT|nr:AraC family transcriptional regulator [Neolewinella lacunae]MBC6992894.1 helix-turn-helix transcriptional regulator [Neolewinella lacunae]MDN3633742.1 AraC family transcriptional regulator [Neolewinella lacunae]
MDANSLPILERVMPSPGASFLVKHYPNPKDRTNKLPKWHYHPELELVYVRGGHGRRHVGSHVSHYRDGELILIGSNLPHWGFTDRFTGNKAETVVQFSASFPNADFLNLPEMRHVSDLMDRARNGISFNGTTRTVQGSRMERLINLDPLSRMLLLIDILHQLAVSNEFESLNVDGLHLQIATHGYDRFNDVQQFISEHFRRDIPLPEVARIASMSEQAFCRYFKKVTGKTFITYLTNYRIVYACKLLADEHSTIAEVAYDCGFNSLSQFNRAFKKHIGRTPTDYRSDLRKSVMGFLPQE